MKFMVFYVSINILIKYTKEEVLIMFTYTNYKSIPSFEQMMLPHLEALSLLNGKASIKNLDAKTIEIMGLPDSLTTIPHNTTKRTEVEYRLPQILMDLIKL